MKKYVTALIPAAFPLFAGAGMSAHHSDMCSHIEFGAGYMWANISPEGQSSTSGNLGGLQGLYEYRAPSMIYAGLTLDWRQGNTSGGGGERSLCYIDLQERLGYSMETFREFGDSTIFTGFGYRHHGEDVTPSSGGALVTFDYNQFYIPLGLLLEGKISARFSMGLNFEWMPQVYPTVKIDPLNGARWILTAEPANFRVAIPLKIHSMDYKNWFFNIQPYFEYWQDGATTAVTPAGLALDIPANTYYFAGVNVNAGYSF